MGRFVEGIPPRGRLFEPEEADATNAQLRILGQQQIAVVQQDSAALAGLNQAVAEAAARREMASDAFKAHAATHGDTRFKERAAE